MKSERVTIITPPRSSVRALSRSVSRKPGPLCAARAGADSLSSGACLEWVWQVAGDPARVRRILVRESPRKHALLPADAEELARYEVDDGQGARPAGGGKVDPDGGHDLPEIDGVAAQGVRPSGDQTPRLGDDGERPPQVGKAPDRVRQPESGQEVRHQPGAFTAAAAGKEWGGYGRKRAGEGDEHDRRPVIGAALGQPRRVQDHKHREVGECQELLADEEGVGRLVNRTQPVPDEQQLARQEDAEEERGEETAENQVAPVGPSALLHLVCDSWGGHARRNLSCWTPGAVPFRALGPAGDHLDPCLR